MVRSPSDIAEKWKRGYEAARPVMKENHKKAMKERDGIKKKSKSNLNK